MPRESMDHPDVPDLAPGRGYSHVVTARGRLVAVAGKVALDPEGAVVGPGDPRAQAQQVFENLQIALRAAGATFADVIKLGYFVTDLSFLPVVREVRDRYVDTKRPPASTAVQVAGLVRPEFLLEIEAWAVVPDR
ncbi:MAG: RidA family protein [Actinomycetota bacterium]